MERNEPNQTKQMILKYLSDGSVRTVHDIGMKLGLSRHGAGMCILRLRRQFLIRRLDAKQDSQQYPIRYEITDKGKDRLRFYESHGAQSKKKEV
jgi:predicted ArsR family transcriptional regulator